MDKSVTKSVQLLVKILDNTSTTTVILPWYYNICTCSLGVSGVIQKITPSQCKLEWRQISIIKLDYYQPTNIQLVKCTHLCRVAAATFLSSPVSLRRQSNFRHDGTNLF